MHATAYASHRPRSRESRPAAIISDASFGTSLVPEGKVALARIRGFSLDARRIVCKAVTPGFHVEQLPSAETTKDHEVIIAVRVFRRFAVGETDCTVRFSLGASTAEASLSLYVH